MIAIKEMNIPNRCEECKFCLRQETNDYGSFGKCLLQKNKRANCLAWNRDDDCSLIKVVTCKDCKSIKVLNKEPCEDAVSRASVFEILGNLMSIPYDLDRPINKDDVSESMDAIRVLPSVTPAPKKCHNENHDYAECDQFVCSNCGIELQDWHRVERDIDTSDITYHQYEFKYCPNCGTRIDSKLPTA